MTSQAETSSTGRFAVLDASIRAAVEAVAAEDPNPTDPFRGLYISDEQALTLAAAGAGADLDERLARAAGLLGLTPVESAVLALCAAPELSPRYGRLYAYLHDDVTRKAATPRLVARLVSEDGLGSEAVLGCFDRSRALRRTGAVRLLGEDAQPLADRPVKIADRLASFLLGVRLDDPGDRLRRVPLPRSDPGRHAAVAELRSLLGQAGTLPVVVAGPDAAGLLAVVVDRPIVLVDAADAADAELLRDADVTAALEGCAVAFDGLERLEPSERGKVVRALSARDERVVVCAASRDAALVLDEQTALVVDVPAPSFAERRAAWAALAGDDDVDEVSAKFRLSVGQIAEAAEIALTAARTRGAERPSAADLDLGARGASTTKLGELATRLEPLFGWKDLVLPERQREVLRSISGYLRHRDLVLSEWGYERTSPNQGLKVLFAGESGTGKTMAGQVLAHELGLDLYRIDLATVVSKYIGETEKNLDRIFNAAEGSNAILFFDEADALFGKRSEVRDAHDRYANIEVAYLLQKMDAYVGAVILATNFRQNMDDAFLRRLDVVVDFPFPETEDRERIWRLVLPDEAPLADDIDVGFLAAQFKLSGGGIRNCSLSAAFMAAEDGGTVAMQHLVRAVALEYGKLGRLTLEADFDRFHELIRRGNGGS